MSTQPETTDDTASTEQAPPPTATHRRGRVVAVAAGATALAVASGLAVTFYLQKTDVEHTEQARAAAQQAACGYAPILASYDAANLDSYFSAVLAGATGEWKKQFDDTSKDLRQVLTAGEVVSKTDKVECAISAIDDTSAQAVVVVGQTITSLGTGHQPAPGQLSMLLGLEKVGDRWLVNKVDTPVGMPKP